MKKSNNKGFSLVELIVVIAIMAVLIGVLAPQFMKYVNNSRISTDITNVDNAVQAINAELAGDETLSLTGTETIDSALYTSLGISGTAPAPKTKGLTGSFTISGTNSDGTVAAVYCATSGISLQLYPDPANTSDGINTKSPGLKK